MSIHTCVCLFFCYAQMDSEGFIPIGLIASFYRVQALTQDVNLILEVCKHNVQELRVAFDEKFVKLHNFSYIITWCMSRWKYWPLNHNCIHLKSTLKIFSPL